MDNFPPFPQSQARIGLLGVAFDLNSSHLQGSAQAPQKIREAFFCPSSNLFAEDETDLGAPGLFADLGDIAPAQGDMAVETDAAASRLHAAGLKVFAFGGDHSVTFPLVRAAARAHPGLTVLHFDAHPDLYNDFDGNPLSHASPLARVMEAGLARRLVQVGIRTINAPQRQQAQRFGVEVLTMANWQAVLDLSFEPPLYLTFDMDCLDPAFAPGVSHWEPGGLSTRETLRIIHSLPPGIVAADLVEFNPARDPSGPTAMVAARVFKEIVARMLA